MKKKMIILRSSTATRDVLRGGPVANATQLGGDDLTIETEELRADELSKLVRDRDVVAVAPTMPMKLIEPVSRAPVEASADPFAWGVKAVGADDSPYSGDGVIVAVLDTGIDAAHEAFRDVEILQKDFTGEGDGDKHGHGTHCAGTIFGRNVGNTRIGVAPGVKKAVIGKVLGQKGGGGSEQIANAIQWAVESGAQIISMSLGIDFPGFVASLTENGYPVDVATSRGLEDYRANVMLFERLASLLRARAAFGQGTLMIAAAGNESRRDDDERFEISVSPPAVAEGIVSVAALGRTTAGLTVASFSNTGANVAGPGVDIQSAKPGGGLASMSGTSMATPHVAGVAALWAQAIRKSGGNVSAQLAPRLVASSVYAGLKSPFDRVDVGAGLVRAPR
jgi:subtilisin family serine protease